MRQDFVKGSIDRSILDDCRFKVITHPTVAKLLENSAAADPAAALWMLRVAAYRHVNALKANTTQAQVRSAVHSLGLFSAQHAHTC